MPNLCVGRLEGHRALVCGLCERNSKLEQFLNYFGEVLEEECLVLCVFFNPLLEGLVSYQGHVGRQHHKRLSGLVFVLSRLLVATSGRENIHHLPAWDHSISSSSTSRPKEACNIRWSQQWERKSKDPRSRFGWCGIGQGRGHRSMRRSPGH